MKLIGLDGSAGLDVSVILNDVEGSSCLSMNATTQESDTVEFFPRERECGENPLGILRARVVDLPFCQDNYLTNKDIYEEIITQKGSEYPYNL